MSRKRWKEIPKDDRDSILNHLKRGAQFCRENKAPKSASAYEAAFNALDVLAKPTLREKFGKTKRSQK